MFRSMIVFLSFAVVAFTQTAAALTLSNESIPYYGDVFYQEVRKGVRDQELIENIRTVLTSKHQKTNGLDQIVRHCDSHARDCYEQRSVGYKSARKILMGNLHLIEVAADEYGIAEVYCQELMTKDSFKSGFKPRPDAIPDNTILNIEHTWPQSRFSRKFDAGVQKADLHHLYPTDSQLNSTRGNFKFAEVDREEKELRCSASKFGQTNEQGGHFFEPPNAHKGNVARALFYFSIRYQLPIDSFEEKFLKKWMKEDPIDAQERTRNEEIYKIQGNRNPFIDFPELVDAISNF